MSATSAEHSSFLTKMFAEGVTNNGALAENKTSRQGVTALTVHSGRVKDRDGYDTRRTQCSYRGMRTSRFGEGYKIGGRRHDRKRLSPKSNGLSVAHYR